MIRQKTLYYLCSVCVEAKRVALFHCIFLMSNNIWLIDYICSSRFKTNGRVWSICARSKGCHRWQSMGTVGSDHLLRLEISAPLSRLRKERLWPDVYTISIHSQDRDGTLGGKLFIFTNIKKHHMVCYEWNWICQTCLIVHISPHENSEGRSQKLKRIIIFRRTQFLWMQDMTARLSKYSQHILEAAWDLLLLQMKCVFVRFSFGREPLKTVVGSSQVTRVGALYITYLWKFACTHTTLVNIIDKMDAQSLWPTSDDHICFI